MNPLTITQRRFARRCAYQNGLLWSLGNNLVSTMLVIYLAMEYNAPGLGLGIGMIIAAPRLIGVLRLVAPMLIDRLASRKRFCIVMYGLSALTLLLLPLVAMPGVMPSASVSLVCLIGLWVIFHLFEYMATVAIWSWLRDLVSPAARGRFFGHRERWLVAGGVLALLVSALHVWGWRTTRPPEEWWLAYAFSSIAGAVCMLLALLPLAAMPSARTLAVERALSLRQFLRPFLDSFFWRFLAFGCFLAFANGLTQSPQLAFPKMALGIGVAMMIMLKATMRLGQWGAGPRVGRLVDRWGNRPVMAVSLLLVATGPLFYLVATSHGWGWIIAAWIVWIAWLGVNVALPNLLLDIAPRSRNTAYIALYFAITAISFAAGALLGGWLFDATSRGSALVFAWEGGGMSYNQYAFLIGWLLRSLSVVLLLLLVRGRMDRESHIHAKKSLSKRPAS